MSNKRCLVAVAVFICALATAQCSWAVSGTWSAGGQTALPVDNTWENVGIAPDYATGNWVGGIKAGGMDAIATFSLDVAAGVPQPVDINYPESIGGMVFSDTNTATAGGWVLNQTDPILGIIALSVTTTNNPPLSTITVNDLGVGAEVKINAPLQGVAPTDGLIKAGSGTLNLAMSATYTGGTIINGGTLKLTAGDNTLDQTGKITVNGTLDLGGFSQTTSGAIVLNGTVQSGTLVNTGVAYNAQSGTVSANLSEVLGTPVGLTKTTGNSLTLSGTNTYTGGTTIREGNVVFSALSAIPATGQIAPTYYHDLVHDSYTTGVLVATGAYSTAQAWLDSGKISTASTGALALTADEGNIDLATGGYASLSIGAATADVNYTGTITPGGNTYYLGGGGSKLTLAGTNQLTDNGLTPRSLVVNGPGTLELSGSNNFTGGTTLRDGVLRVGSDASLGGPNTQLTLNGGLLSITGSGLTLDNRNVNWSTFNGGFQIESGVTFTLNINVPDGVTFSKTGPGTMNIAGNYVVSKELALNEGSVFVAAGANFTSGSAMDLLNSGLNGNITIGEAGSSLATSLVVTGGIAGDPYYTGYIKLGGGDGTATMNIYGNNTIVKTTTGENFISMGEWGNGVQTINIHDSALLTSGEIDVGKWGSQHATVNMYDHAHFEANKVIAGFATTGILNLFNNSSMAANELDIAYHNSHGTLNIGDTATDTATDHPTATFGVVYAGMDDWWDGSATANTTVQGYAHLNVVTSATLTDGFSVSGSGNLYVASGSGGGNLNNSVLTITDHAVVSIENTLQTGAYMNNAGVINVSGNAQLTAGGIKILGSWWGQQTHQLNISGSAQVTTPLVTIGDDGNDTTGNVNLNGGTLSTGQIVADSSGKGNVLFNGGILQATADSLTFMEGLRSAKIDAGGAKIDTHGHNITIAQSISEITLNTGNLTKLGSGTLTLTGALHFQGTTDIQADTLKISTGTPTQIGNVNGAGTLDVEGATSLGAFSVNVGNVTIDGASSLTTANVGTGTLTIGAGSTLTITPIPGGPTAGGGMMAVPEPSTIAMLAIAAFGLIAAAWRRRK